jgi:hypothetical protein
MIKNLTMDDSNNSNNGHNNYGTTNRVETVPVQEAEIPVNVLADVPVPLGYLFRLVLISLCFCQFHGTKR